MRIADLYIRVSTDEQADKGYSQRNQEEVLRRYCDNHCIQVRRVVYEDHSAKTFNRPEWSKLLTELQSVNRILTYYYSQSGIGSVATPAMLTR